MSTPPRGAARACRGRARRVAIHFRTSMRAHLVAMIVAISLAGCAAAPAGEHDGAIARDADDAVATDAADATDATGALHDARDTSADLDAVDAISTADSSALPDTGPDCATVSLPPVLTYNLRAGAFPNSGHPDVAVHVPAG